MKGYLTHIELKMHFSGCGSHLLLLSGLQMIVSRKKKICEDIIHIGHMLYFLKHHSEELECWFQDKVSDVEKTILVQDLNVFIFKVMRPR